MKVNRRTISTVITAMAVLLLAAALPSAIQDTIETGASTFSRGSSLRNCRNASPVLDVSGLFFSRQWPFCSGGAQAWRMPGQDSLYGLITGAWLRKELVSSGWADVRDLVAMGIVLDAVAQFLIYRQVHPGAALALGPVLICLPYSLSRALVNRLTKLMHCKPRG
jgi:hypothetical protein